MLFPDTYVEVILPLGIPNLYTYKVPTEFENTVEIGYRVIVQFGKSKLYSAIVAKVHQTAPKNYVAKEIHLILDESPVVKPYQLDFWNWISSYYLCNPGDVMGAALPGGLKLSSETQILINTDVDYDATHLTDDEFILMEALSINEVLSLQEVAKILNKKTTYPIIKSLLERQIIVVLEEIKTKFKPKKEKYVHLSAHFTEEKNLQELFNQLGKAPKQLALLMKYVELSRMFSDEITSVKQKVLLTESNTTHSQLKSLVTKGVFEIEEVVIGRIGFADVEEKKEVTLNPNQDQALKSIQDQFEKKDVVLLHGVTSSGKTEIYVKLIEEAIANKKQVLYLLPEIALTTQIISRLRLYFGDKIGVYHSRFNQNERVEVWNKQLSPKGYDIILGARSSLFLPFDNLGLVIIDEEHDSSFKQFEPAPRYHARDAAIVLAHKLGAKVVMGSATPALETMYNAQSGKYGLVTLNQRHGNVKMPQIITADLAQAHKKKKMQGHFSHQLIQEIDEALVNKEQVILFQNRRGFSPYIICQTCGWTPYCTRCDVGLTYHKYLHRLKCHYCGYESFMPKKCGACGSHEVELSGFGTEKIEEDISLMFPDAKVGRLDLETTRTKNAYQQIISDFEDKHIDILVGTQMVTKGLDFENVSLVGVLNADQSLNFQDFRAHERSYQLMSQVAGRAGRSAKQGRVIIQTFQPEHPIIQQVVHTQYPEMYARELELRKEYDYPPYYRLIKILLKHINKEKLEEAAKQFGDLLLASFGNRVMGPLYPGIPRVRNKYINQLYIKVENTASISVTKSTLVENIDSFRTLKAFSSVQILIDVDPY